MIVRAVEILVLSRDDYKTFCKLPNVSEEAANNAFPAQMRPSARCE